MEAAVVAMSLAGVALSFVALTSLANAVSETVLSSGETTKMVWSPGWPRRAVSIAFMVALGSPPSIGTIRAVICRVGMTMEALLEQAVEGKSAGQCAEVAVQKSCG